MAHEEDIEAIQREELLPEKTVVPEERLEVNFENTPAGPVGSVSFYIDIVNQLMAKLECNAEHVVPVVEEVI